MERPPFGAVIAGGLGPVERRLALGAVEAAEAVSYTHLTLPTSDLV